MGTQNSGTGVYYGDIKIPLLLFQDDIVKFETSHPNMQKSNKALEVFQNINRMEYHETKTQLMTNNKKPTPIYMNGNELQVVEEYKYLGDIIRIDDKYSSMIKERKNSITGLVAEIVSISCELKELSILASLQYLQGIIIPKLLLNSETWNNLVNQDIEEMEQIQSQNIKRMLKIPYTTPTRGLYHELGI